MSPTARTRRLLEDEGYTVGVVERWLPSNSGGFGTRSDLWGFLDLLAMKAGHPIIGIQATSGSNVSSRVKKILEIPLHRVWLLCGCRIQVIGWRKVCKRKADGTRSKQKVWRPVVREVTL